jgi:ligand-binding sensor domain-containing protein
MTRFLLCFYLCMLSETLLANSGFRFRYIDLPNTLREGNIKDMEIDRHGLLWISTSRGLHRYDGNRILTFDLVSKPAIINIAITRLYADKADNLWVGTQSGITKFDLKKWTTTSINQKGQPGRPSRSLFVKEFYEAKDGTIYVGSSDAKIYRIVKDQLELVTDLAKVNPNPSGLSSIEMIREIEGEELLVTCNGRFVTLKKQNGSYALNRYYPMPEIDGQISKEIFYHPSGKVIFYVETRGVYTLNLQTSSVEPLAYAVKDSITKEDRAYLFPLPHNRLGIFFNNRGFFSYDVKDAQAQAYAPGLADYFRNIRVRYIRENKQKLYFGFHKGIAEVQQVNSPFTNTLSTPSIETSPLSIRSMYRHDDGMFYIGSYKDGFSRLNMSTGERQVLSKKIVYTSLLWSKDRLLLATEGDGLQWFDLRSQTMQPLLLDTTSIPYNKRLHNRYMLSLNRENDSMVWVGTYFGVYLLNVNTGISRISFKGPAEEILRQSKVYDIIIHGNKRYFATLEGIFAYTPENGQLLRLFEDDGPSYAGGDYYCIEPVQQEFWAGTNGRGILVFNEQGKVLREINVSNGLAGNAVYTLIRQGEEVIVGTDQGLSLINIHDQRIRNYTRLDHLPSNEFNHSAFLSYKDQVFLGTLNGITAFTVKDLKAYKPADTLVSLCFTAFTTGTKNKLQHDFTMPYRPLSAIVVNPEVQYFSLRFGGVDNAIEQLHYYYRLTEKTAWQEIGRQHEMSFVGLAPGDYNLELVTLLPGEKVYKTIMSIPLIVNPAYYQTWWFRILVLLVLTGIGWLIFRYRMRELLKEQQLRTKIAGDLHDEVGSSLTRIYFQADRLSTQPGDMISLQKIAASSKDALSTMSDMVWSIDSRFDTAADLVSRIKDHLMNLQNDLDLTCSLTLKGDYAARSLSQMVRQNFFLIFKEAVNNAARYASGPQMKIALTFGPEIVLQVSNAYDGSRMKMKSYQGGQGLQHMRLRAEKMKGTLEVRAEESVFELCLRVPG